MTWSGLNGAVNMYFDGHKKSLSSNALVEGHLNGGGILNVGASFYPTVNPFSLNMTEVNIWDRVLRPSEILANSFGCYKGKGNLREWDDFRPGIEPYTNNFVEPSTCPYRFAPVSESDEESTTEDQVSLRDLREKAKKKARLPKPAKKVTRGNVKRGKKKKRA